MKLLSREEYESQAHNHKRCLFCAWEATQDVVKEYSNWVLINAISPYYQFHMMLIPKSHKTRLFQLDKEEEEELAVISYGLEEHFTKGDFTHEDGTIVERVMYMWRHRPKSDKKMEHLHIHVILDKDGLLDASFDDLAYKKPKITSLGLPKAVNKK